MLETARRAAAGDGPREAEMVNAPMRWPEAMPDDVKVLIEKLMGVLKDHRGETIGPALSLVYAFTSCQLGGHGNDTAAIEQMVDDLATLIVRYDAAIERAH